MVMMSTALIGAIIFLIFNAVLLLLPMGIFFLLLARLTFLFHRDILH
jgi:hypothetical protein